MSKIIADALFPTSRKRPRSSRQSIRRARRVHHARFAPSPTGFMHIGGLYTALLNCLVAREKDGVFLLRIEDTDQKRQVEGGVSEIISSLRDFDIRFDEGPANETEDYGGYGPLPPVPAPGDLSDLRQGSRRAGSRLSVLLQRGGSCRLCVSSRSRPVSRRRATSASGPSGVTSRTSACSKSCRRASPMSSA